jgi:hypothetical protein
MSDQIPENLSKTTVPVRTDARVTEPVGSGAIHPSFDREAKLSSSGAD